MSSPVDNEDEVVMRLPVYLRSSDPRTPVCLFQYPLRPRWRPYNLEDVAKARVRPEQRRVELSLGTECSPAHFDEDSPSPMTNISLASTTTRSKTSYAIGMLRTDESGKPVSLNLTPLAATVQLRPSFALLDQADGDAASKTPPRSAARSTNGDDPMGDSSVHGAASSVASEGGADDDDDAGGGVDGAVGGGNATGTSTLAPLLRPAQTEREIEARRSSHAYLVEQREAEPWSKATLHAPDSTESIATRERCFGPLT